MNPTERIAAVAIRLLHTMRYQPDSERQPGPTGAPSAPAPAALPRLMAVTPLATNAAPEVQVRTVAHHTSQGQVHDVACSSCGIIATRALDADAEEEARWHRQRGWHHGMYPGHRSAPDDANVIPLRPAPTEETP